MTDREIEERCADGRACVEVTARIEAAHVAKYIDSDVAQADQLLAAAQRWADAHGHGSTAPGARVEDGAA